ncbi:hypothetical protein FRC08_013415 [Ceratobasidium sp. 394]|nr:hypothetical protein FRC08_013415 [Ceratobasidium sp. 394]KAG9101231.1 hypothetical protein FS749_009158 [Ceratobasidium sp. UAMH 11750]
MSEQVFVLGQRHLHFDGSQPAAVPRQHQDLEYGASSCTTIAPSYISTYSPPSYHPASDPSYTRPPVDRSNAPLATIRLPDISSHDLHVNVKFEHDLTRPALAREGGRRRRRMTVSSVGLGESEFTPLLNRDPRPNPELQSNSSSTSVAGWFMRTLSIGDHLGTGRSDGTQDREAGLPRTPNKLTKNPTKAHTRSKRATSAISLPPGIEAGSSPLALSPPASPTDDRAGGESHTGYDTTNEDKSAVHRNTISPVSTRLSHSTTQSVPVRPHTGRKLVKRQKSQPEPVSKNGDDQGGLEPEQAGSFNDHAFAIDWLTGLLRQVAQAQTIFTHEAVFPNGYCIAADVRAWDRNAAPAPSPSSPQRCWTLVDIDDDEFLRQIEARLGCDGTRLKKSRMLEDFVMGTSQDRRDVELEAGIGYETDESAAEREFARGRRAILCVREIVRTERSYLQFMAALLQENQSTMSPVLLEHLPGLIKAAAGFIHRLEEDPSVWGASAAFLAVERQLEEVLVKWSGVVGQVISSIRTQGNEQSVSEDGHAYGSTSGKISSLWARRRSEPSVAFPSQQLRLNPATMPANDTRSTHAANRRKLAEQNVAIMPTQRALRYVLMYRELLLHTPLDSLSRPQVELALQGATRIARLCDEAQTLVAMHSPK